MIRALQIGTILFPPTALAIAAWSGGSLPAVSVEVRWSLGVLLGLACLAAAIALSLQQLLRWRIPGCSGDDGCADLTGSRFGAIFGWPVSFLGTAWFSGMFAFLAVYGWRAEFPLPLRLGLSAGGAGSLFFLAVILWERHFCPYCLLVHSGNLSLAALALSAPSGAMLEWGSVCAAIAGLAAFSGAIGLLRWGRARAKRAAAARRERQFQQSLRQIQRELRDGQRAAEPRALRGRWRRGPDAAPIGLTIFADYQCSDCRAMEGLLERALAGRCDVAVTLKHYPLCRDCNRRIKASNDHRHGCRAAYAAEAAGLLWGNEGFWRMHAWLLSQPREFSDEEFASAVPGLGFQDVQRFLAAIRSPEVLRRVRQDVEEGIALRIDGTPAVFVNGLRLEGATADRALERALEVLGPAVGDIARRAR